MKDSEIFENLFVLEIANNHWGDLDRGLRIIREHGKVVKKHGVKAAVKFQFRDPKGFVHKDFQGTKVDKEVTNAPGSYTRYVKKTLSTILSEDQYKIMINEVKKLGMIAMATPFDEESVKMCERLGIEIMKISSNDAGAMHMIERIADLGKPTILSPGGTDIEPVDKVVKMFKEKNTPLAINHCVSLYPSEDDELNLDHVDFLKKRYPDHVIGFSTHEYHDWTSSVMMTYAKGARTWERHVDIEADGVPVSKYCSLPHQVDEWFGAFRKAQEMCGHIKSEGGRDISEREREYVKSVSRGIYAKKDLPKGYKLHCSNLNEDFYMAIPAIEGQYTARDLDNGIELKNDVKKDKPVMK